MDEKKQIEKMAELMCNIYADGICTVDDMVCDHNCGWKQTAKRLYNAGYRKQSEDTVEVVRCKDCVYFKQSVSALFPHASAFVCDCPYGLQRNVNENDFCCHGAKMKGGAE